MSKIWEATIKLNIQANGSEESVLERFRGHIDELFRDTVQDVSITESKKSGLSDDEVLDEAQFL